MDFTQIWPLSSEDVVPTLAPPLHLSEFTYGMAAESLFDLIPISIRKMPVMNKTSFI